MIMTNKEFYEFIIRLSKTPDFVNCLPISDRRTDEQYRVELLLRMLIPEYIDWENIGQYSDFSQLLDKETLRLCDLELNFEAIEKSFSGTFSLLYGIFEENVFRKYNGTKYFGPFMAAAFQPTATGVYHNIDAILALENKSDWLREKVHNLYTTTEFIKNTTPGVRSIPRFKELSQFGVEYFKP